MVTKKAIISGELVCEETVRETETIEYIFW